MTMNSPITQSDINKAIESLKQTPNVAHGTGLFRDNDGQLMLPNNKPAEDPEACSQWLRDHLGQGAVVAFNTQKNPSESMLINANDNYAFVMVDERYCLDAWRALFCEHIDATTTLDLEHKDQLQQAKKHYGNPENWVIVDEDPNQLFKMALESAYSTEEAIGVYYGDYDTGKSSEQYRKETGRELEEESALLPNGEPMSRCTHCAEWLRDNLGEGTVWGFAAKNNPVPCEGIREFTGGHDFLVVRNRFIVDPWISAYTGMENQTVYDLKNPKDHDKIRHYYGNPASWAQQNTEKGRFIKPDDPGFNQRKQQLILDNAQQSGFRPPNLKHYENTNIIEPLGK